MLRRYSLFLLHQLASLLVLKSHFSQTLSQLIITLLTCVNIQPEIIVYIVTGNIAYVDLGIDWIVPLSMWHGSAPSAHTSRRSPLTYTQIPIARTWRPIAVLCDE